MTGIGGHDRVAERMDERPERNEAKRRGAALGAEKGGRWSSRLEIRGVEFEQWQRKRIFVDVRYASVEGRAGGTSIYSRCLGHSWEVEEEGSVGEGDRGWRGWDVLLAQIGGAEVEGKGVGRNEGGRKG